MTKVLIWHWGRRGGGPRYTYELVNALRNQANLDVTISLSRQCEIFRDFEALGLPSYHIDTYDSIVGAGLSLLWLPVLRRRFGQWLRNQQFDVVVCTMSHLWNVSMLPAIKASGTKYLLVLHDAVPHPGENYLVRKWLLAREIHATDGIVALTESVRRTLCDFYKYAKRRAWVVPHGVFTYHHVNRARVYHDGRAFRLLFFGRLLPYKGLALLLDAYRQLVASGRTVSLMIAGPGDLSPYSEQIRSMPGVAVDNRWIPEDEIGDFFEEADLVVTPYVEASQSGVIATAYAAALPVVATPVGGLTEQIKPGVTGLVAESVSAQAVAEAIGQFLNQPALYEHCSAGALYEAGTRLAWPAVAADFARVIRQVHELPARTEG